MTTAITKNIGSPRTINAVQKARKIVSVALVVDDAGAYSVIISYKETDTDENSVLVSTVNATKTILDAQLPNAAKNEIDSVYTRALAAI